MKEILIDTIIEMAKKEQRLQSQILNLEAKLSALKFQSVQKHTEKFHDMVKEIQKKDNKN